MDVPETDQRTEKRVQLVFSRFTPRSAEEGARVSIEFKKRKLGGHKIPEQRLKPTELVAPHNSGALFVFYDTPQAT